jgi:tRNA (guanine-N7-)-methyltransferase
MRVRPHFNPFNIREPNECPDWHKIFNNDYPLDLEIGCSTGKWLLEYAEKFPERNIIGVEIRTKYIEHVRQKITDKGLKNCYIVQANINTSLEKLFSGIKLSKIFIMFPDPWYKERHLKRRVVNPNFIEDISGYLSGQGELQIATDREQLAKDMLLDLEKSDKFKNIYGAGCYADKNIEGLVTDIEAYVQKKGEPIYRMAFSRK